MKMFKNAELNCIQRGNDLLTMQCIQCRESKNAIKTTITLDEVQGAHDNNVCTLSLGVSITMRNTFGLRAGYMLRSH